MDCVGVYFDVCAGVFSGLYAGVLSGNLCILVVS
jgi:hypothetical protein